ncbi:MAG: outer membrane beta-barrel protein [Zhongshania sp.]|uniref:outer membrane beta-barrel protein n=1 Tax=Zhongshania sp. TaxID=1971902 RepID=UPI0026180EBB|nr:outer membrane beta-barrel protein [Zhongshania sp.]MDF1693934.1 outer membrane beta-barrel protein [Zhongshania sp.]
MRAIYSHSLALLAAVVGTTSLASTAFANPTAGPHAYVGANYGGYKDRGGDFDEDDDFKEALIGAQVNQFLGFEASYIDFGSFGGDVGKADVDGYGLAVVGRLPLTEQLGIYAKAGQLFWDADVRVAGLKQSYDGDEPFVGIGADIKVSEHFVVALEYDCYKIDLDDSSFPAPASNWEGDMDTVKLGARFMF